MPPRRRARPTALPLLALPHDLVVQVLVALASDPTSLCRVVQTCQRLCQMEGAHRRALWERARQSLRPSASPDPDSPDPWWHFALSRTSVELSEQTQTMLGIDDKAVVRLSLTQGPFSLEQDRPEGRRALPSLSAEPDLTFSLAALEERFAFLVEFQCGDRRNSFAVPLTVRKKAGSAVPDHALCMGGGGFEWSDPQDTDWATFDGWSCGLNGRSKAFDDVRAAVVLARDRTTNSVTILMVGTDPDPANVEEDTDVCTFQAAKNRAWTTIEEQPLELFVFADRTGTSIASVRVWITCDANSFNDEYFMVSDLARAVGSRETPWVPCA